MRRYVGISGISDQGETQAISAILDRIDPEQTFYSAENTRVALGVLASAKTLRGEGNRYPLRYPRRDTIASCFSDDPRILNVIHVSDDDSARCGDVLLDGLDAAGRRCQALQINVAWPDLDELQRAREHAARLHGKHFSFILQVGPRSLEAFLPRLRMRRELAESPLFSLAHHLKPYVVSIESAAALVDHVLLDVSAGRGEAIDPLVADRLIPYLATVFDDGGGARFGVAGGLDGAHLEKFSRLLRGHHATNIDAEGKLRDDEPGGGRLDLAKVERYLVAAREAYEPSAREIQPRKAGVNDPFNDW